MGRRTVIRCVTLAVVSAAACCGCGWQLYQGAQSPAYGVLYSISGLMLCLATIVCLDMAIHNPADSHSFNSLLKLYRTQRMAQIRGRRHVKRILRLMKTVPEAQQVVLSDIMHTQEKTFYGNKYQFQTILTMEEFQERVPLTSYQTYEPYVERIAAGGRNVLTTERVIAMATTTSENSNRSKMLPIGWHTLKARSEANDMLSYLLALKNVKLNLGKKFLLAYKPKVCMSNGGVPCGPLSFFLQPHFNFFVTPRAIFDIVDKKMAMYINAVFGLAEKELVDFLGTTANVTLTFWTTVKEQWSDICDDIESGKLSKELNLEPPMRAAFEKYLKPLPHRAAALRKEFEKGMAGISKRVWPSCDVVRMRNAGRYAKYARTLAGSFMKDVYQFNPLHTLDEGIVGINIGNSSGRPNHFSFLLEENVYEFIPLAQCGDPDPETICLHEVEVGKRYEVVMSTRTGLYRYRLGEIVQITGKHNDCPTYFIPHRLEYTSDPSVGLENDE